MTLIRLTCLLGFTSLALVLLGLATVLSVMGYLAAHIGATGLAGLLFTAALCPVALLALLGSFIPDTWTRV